MRVLNVNSILDPVLGGGTAERTLQISRFLKRAGIACRILTTDAGVRSRIPSAAGDVEIVVLPCVNKRFRIPWGGSQLIRSIVEDADVVHLMDHWTVLNLLVYRVVRRLRKPYVVCPAGALPIFGRSKALKRIYNHYIGYEMIRRADGHVAVTVAESQQFESYGVDPASVAVIQNGVDIDERGRPDDRKFRERYGLQKSPFILFVGRINVIKGPDLLLRAFQSAKDDLKEYHLVFAGPDGGMLKELMKMARNDGGSERVHFTGFIEGADKRAAYAASDVVVIPSRQEAMSLVVLEAGAAGTPVIMTDQCGFDELAHCGGGIVANATVDALREAMVDVLKDRGRQLMMGKKIKEFVHENYGWEKAAEKYIRLYISMPRR